jgi:HK97 gp10 family phage protein
MSGFNLEIKGLNELMKTVEKYPNISEKHINKAINRSLIRIQDQAKKNAPSGDTQQLRQNWKIFMGRFAGELSSGAKNKGYQYGLVVEGGRRAGKGFPYKDPLFVAWCKKRGLSPFLVMRSIKRKGIKARPFFQPAIDSQQANVDREFSKAMDNILKEL